jgi:hypothetical protein
LEGAGTGPGTQQRRLALKLGAVRADTGRMNLSNLSPETLVKILPLLAVRAESDRLKKIRDEARADASRSS